MTDVPPTKDEESQDETQPTSGSSTPSSNQSPTTTTTQPPSTHSSPTSSPSGQSSSPTAAYRSPSQKTGSFYSPSQATMGAAVAHSPGFVSLEPTQKQPSPLSMNNNSLSFSGLDAGDNDDSL